MLFRDAIAPRNLSRIRRMVRLVSAIGLILGLLLPVTTSFGQAAPSSPGTSGIARLGVRITGAGDVPTVSGILYALDGSGRAIANLDAAALTATVDRTPVQLSLLNGRPSIALAAAFLLDSLASPQVRNSVANAMAESVQSMDVNRDTVAIASTADTTPWEQAAFTTSADDLKARLNQVIQSAPNDGAATLEQVSGLLKGLRAQQRDTRVLLLFTNRPLASAATANTSLGAIRSFAADNAIQLSVVSLPGAGGQGPAEALAEATPAGRVEYVLNATNTQDLSRRVSLLLAPALGARRFELAAPGEGSHTLKVGAPGVTLQASAPFQVTGHAVPVASLQTSAGALKSGDQITEPTWVQAQPAVGVGVGVGENALIDSVEWSLDGAVTQATSADTGYAFLIDPEQVGDGSHDLSARIISQGRAGPIVTSTITVPPDVLRAVRVAVRNWGLLVLLLLAEIVIVILFLRLAPAARSARAQTTEFPPMLRLNPQSRSYVAPEVIEFPARGKLRIGYHPPYMDNQVGARDFSRLAYQDIRGDDDAVKDLSRHAACIWRDDKTNDCYIQLGWTGPGEPLKPKPQSQVFHFGRPADAATDPFRLVHHDVVRLATGVEYVFNQVALRDKATPESKKLSPFEVRPAVPTGRVSIVSDPAHQMPSTPTETMAEEG